MTLDNGTAASSAVRERTLAERIAEDYAEAWRPESGGSLIGFVQEISEGQTDYGDYPIVTVVTPDGRRSIHAFHSVLREALIEAMPGIGEEIAVKYNGLRLPKGETFDEKTGKNGRGTKEDPRYHDYRVIVNRAPADVWGKFSAGKKRGVRELDDTTT